MPSGPLGADSRHRGGSTLRGATSIPFTALLSGAPRLFKRRFNVAVTVGQARLVVLARITLVPMVVFTTGVAISAVAFRLSNPTIAGLALVLLLGSAVLGTLRLISQNQDQARLSQSLAEHKRELFRQVLHDPLTGQASRPLFTHALELALGEHDRGPIAVMLVDLNAFKSINDDLGHAVGDRLLAHVAWRLNSQLPSSATLARTGADEFGILIVGLDPTSAPSATRQIATELNNCLEHPFDIDGRQITTSMTVGFVVVEAGAAMGVDAVLRRADIALQTARRRHSRMPQAYVEGLSLSDAQDWQLQPALAQALRNGQIRPHYQPVVDLDHGEVRAFEALARWLQPEVPRPGPDTFLPVITRAGLLGQLTDQMILAGARQAALWRARPEGADIRVAINVSPTTIVDPAFPDRIAEVLQENQLDGSGLILEITEERILDDIETARTVLDQVRSLGIRIWLDDFGCGYSSLAMLHRLPLEALKLDKALTAAIETDPAQRRLVSGLLALSRDLGLPVIAEGVQRRQQAVVLRELGCPLGQGFLFGAPTAPAKAIEALTRRSPILAVAEAPAVRARRVLHTPGEVNLTALHHAVPAP